MPKGSKTPVIPPAFAWSQLWSPAIVNPVNLKSYTLPLLNLRDPYARAFHLSWLSFFVAFLSWFAFPPLIPEAIKSDLKLTTAQVNNSNIVALAATLIVRFAVGPMVDAFGPRKVMAGLLVLGAVPSGLAGTAHNANTLYVIRFFIGILGGTFVPCQAWTSAWFDKNCVGTVNALVGGWGNMGGLDRGGATFAIMTSLYAALVKIGMTQHVAWRASFAIVPLPCLLLVAIMILIFGQDHPAGKWSERQNLPASAITEKQARHIHLGVDTTNKIFSKKKDKHDQHSDNKITVHPVDDPDVDVVIDSTVDVAVNENLTLESAVRIGLSPLTWLPTLAYLTTFGLELALDAQMANILFVLYNKRIQGFDQTKAGYYTSIFGFLNLFTRPFGGYVGDVVYRKWGTKGKKYWMLLCGLIMGVSCLAGGFYLAGSKSPSGPDFNVVMAVFAITAIFSEFGNGANFALVPHCNSYNNGVMSGIVGSFGNLGGIIFALVFRFQPAEGKAFWIIGVICVVINAVLVIVSVPKY
ncbi:hypothetical protein C0995_007405 [Termitomyces sp. Mi166|nr:hypothetical protein C0995_007405 [Termitomyces sp. Mi166\